jgi:carbon-monoxide dehydrogenase small subunit
MAATQINLVVNKQTVELHVEPHKTLLQALRDELALTGTKEGCGTGDCGSCTVLVDGKTVCSCLKLAVETDGQDVVTIEGLAIGAQLHRIQNAFIEKGGLQCGFCTPGVIMSSAALLDENKEPSEIEVREALAGNLCRCTGYDKIIRAVQAAAVEMGNA